ncbi:MAG: hypothetical protein K9M99_09210 [Candidatus Cloacimonetes bacterium]|nr:hypothetical protein [Candidatus Cloacimonadota bacterium]
MKNITLFLLFIMLFFAMNIQAQESGSFATHPGYYGVFFDTDVFFSFFTLLRGRFSDVFESYSQAEISCTYRGKIADRIQINATAATGSSIHASKYIDNESGGFIDNYSEKKSLTCLFLESITSITEILNFYLAIDYISGESKNTLHSFEHTYYKSSGIYQTGFSTEGIKGIKFLTPGYEFEKGLFTELLYAGYIFRKSGSTSLEDNPHYLLANLRYAYLTNYNFMLTPALANNYDLQSKILTSTAAISLLYDSSINCRLKIDLSNDFTFHKDSKTNSQATLDLKLDYFVNCWSACLDFYYGLNITSLDSNDNEYSAVESRNKVTHAFGVRLLLGY